MVGIDENGRSLLLEGESNMQPYIPWLACYTAELLDKEQITVNPISIFVCYHKKFTLNLTV